MALQTTVVIPTCGRPEPLHAALATIALQTRKPLEVIIVDSSVDLASSEVVQYFSPRLFCPILLIHSGIRSVSIQRKQGAEESRGDIVLFIDDDVELEPSCLGELLKVFDADTSGAVGGVCGNIVNEAFCPISRLNRFALGLLSGDFSGRYEGRLIGPAIQFRPSREGDSPQRADWLHGGCSAYRKSALTGYEYWDCFEGYSIYEDVCLSTWVGRRYNLFSAPNARLTHRSLGARSHKDWFVLGKSAFINHFAVMSYCRGQRSTLDRIRFLLYEFIYVPMGSMWNGGHGSNPGKIFLFQLGRVAGMWQVLRRRTYFAAAHRTSVAHRM